MSSHLRSTPKRSPKKVPSFGKIGVPTTKSTPNLNAAYNSSLLQATTPALPSLNNGFDFGLNNKSPRPPLPRQASLASLTSGSLAAIPDASKRYPLSTVFDEDIPTIGNMPPYTPSRLGGGSEELEVGDWVDVPGNMHGTVKFVGSVQGKKGIFAGVELSEEFAVKGKNNGDVDGVHYFSTNIDGAGIFLPVGRATRRSPPSSHEGSFPLTPSSPSLSNKNGGLASSIWTPPTPSVPKFSQSVGPGRAPSPFVKKTRPSMARPESPVRRPATTRPSLNTPQPRVTSGLASSRYASPAPTNFGQSVRGTQDSRGTNKRGGNTPRNGFRHPRSASGFGAGAGSTPFSDEDGTPVGISRAKTHGSISSVSSFNAKLRPTSRAPSRATDDELDRLRGQLEDRDRQLREQASTLAEMENSLNEVQTLMNNDGAVGGNRHSRGSMEDKDASQLRIILREKNEKIAMLTAEFDAHRADFRSTIDTLELASTETERVYEKRVEDLMMEVREMQERSEDVDSVARQLKQLEELVQELEEGLEDARRGEAEARGEVEFLRGEVERTRSELRREREKTAAAISNASASTNGDMGALSKELQQRDDEIRGLKAIIHSLSRDAIPESSSPTDMDKTPTHRVGLNRSRQGSNTGISTEDRLAREKLEREVTELRAVIESKDNKEEQMEREMEGLRRASVSSPTNRTSAMSIGTVTQDRNSLRDSKGSWRDREGVTGAHKLTLETMPESDTYSSAAESFCELCETSGHDILTCTNMFSPGGHARTISAPPAPPQPQHQRTDSNAVMEGLKLSPKSPQDEYKPLPLSPMKKLPEPETETGVEDEAPTPVRIAPNPMESGPVAGKESGVINMDKWCGVCEREGHDSIDCPFEDDF